MLFTFCLIESISLQALAIETSSWLETQDNTNKLGVEKIWFSSDLNKAVFLRAHRQQKLNSQNQFLKAATQLNPKISQLNDTLYFYNMSDYEIQNWVKKNIPNNKTAIWFSLFASTAYANSATCPSNKSATSNDSSNMDSFYRSFVGIVNGDFLKKMVGCSTQDPTINEKQNQSLSIENFGMVLKEHWEQLKEIISQLPNMPLPEEIKKELLCDGLSVGIFIAQGAALSGLTGVGAYVVVPRLYVALKRLLQTAKYLKKFKVKAKGAVAFEISNVTKTKNIYRTQKSYIKSLQDGARQILDKGRIAESGKNGNYFSELRITANTELEMQKDLLVTLNNLEKENKISTFGKKLSIKTERESIKNRIITLEKITGPEGALNAGGVFSDIIY